MFQGNAQCNIHKKARGEDSKKNVNKKEIM